MGSDSLTNSIPGSNVWLSSSASAILAYLEKLTHHPNPMRPDDSACGSGTAAVARLAPMHLFAGLSVKEFGAAKAPAPMPKAEKK
jgi:hypothetical protein